MRKVPLFALAAVALAVAPAEAQTRPTRPAEEGPLIREYGATFPVPEATLKADPRARYRVVFEVAESAAEPGQINPYINTVARFLNMHARAGVPAENMELALVLHGNAARDALMEGPFRKRYGVDNANVGLLKALGDAGVRVYMCGQSAASRGLAAEELTAPVEMALSAMTAMWTLKAEGYREVN